MTNPPRLSVVIPAFGARGLLPDAVRSARAQGPDVEVVVVVDGPDAALEQEARGADVVHVLAKRSGAAAARNAGVQLAHADLLLFLDADDLLLPGGAHQLARAIDAPVPLALSGPAVLAYGEVEVDDGEHVRAHRPRFASRPTGAVLGALLRRNFISTGAVLVRRAAFVEAGGFPVDVRRAHDWVLWCRVAATGPVCHAGPSPVARIRWRRDGISATLGTDPDSLDTALDAVFSDVRITRRYSAAQLAAARAGHEAWGLGVAAAECLKVGRTHDARRLYWRALTRRPTPREALLLAATFSRRATAAALEHLR